MKRNGTPAPAGIRFHLNENAWGPSPAAIRAVRGLRARDLACYPDPSRAAAATAAFHRVRPENVLLTNGADEAIHAAVRALVPPRGKILLPGPSFAVYDKAARLRGAKVASVLYEPDLSFPLKAVLEKIGEGIRLVVVVTPNNPTGTVASRPVLGKILDRAGAIPVVVDETYALFEGVRHGGMLRRRPNLVVIGSFSKFFGLAGLRLGYVLAAPDAVRKLGAVLPEYTVNAAALLAAEAAMADRAHQGRVRREAAAQKKHLGSGLSRLGVPVFPGGGNFVVARVGPGAARVTQGLKKAGILVKDIAGRARLEGCLRITVGKRKDNERLLDALRGLLPPQAVLFDMDGVLVDTRESCRKTMKAVLERCLGKPVPAKAIDARKLSGGANNDWDLVLAFLRARGIRMTRAAVIRFFQAVYFGKNGEGLISREAWLPPRDALARLAARFRLGIVTGRPRAEALHTLKKFGAAGFFSVVVAMEDAGRKKKPDPFGVRLAMKRLGVRRAAYVGDLPDDMLAARGAGALPVAVLPAGRPRRAEWARKLRKAGAAEIIPHVARIEEVLK
ncbi:MAG: aminotransferase class I/II-fold pyridoxal phosphate-dependent enzyme [Candidatus Aminicenantes bacterium]|nr:aminotransferase class I/II-fold pyridoxal phosphate-dependent enzyme [Candidatus Aminicenantes bacterium]